MRSLIRRDPFGVSLRDAVNRMVDESFLRPPWWPEFGAGGIAVDLYETDDAVVVKATIPGVKAEDLDVSVEGNLLTLKGEFKEDKEVKEENYLRQERWMGSFCRSVEIPSSVDADNADATFEDGVLTLSLPKREELKPKTIKVKSN